jgi:hypothetical protein
MKCAVCDHRLNQRFEITNNQVTDEIWEHAYEHDHPAVPIEEEVPPTVVCDFCGDEAPEAFVIKCLPYLVITEDEKGHRTEHRDDGEWGACTECGAAFNPMHMEALLERVRAKQKARYTDPGAFIQIPEADVDDYIDNAVKPLYQHIADTLYAFSPTGGSAHG